MPNIFFVLYFSSCCHINFINKFRILVILYYLIKNNDKILIYFSENNIFKLIIFKRAQFHIPVSGHALNASLLLCVCFLLLQVFEYHTQIIIWPGELLEEKKRKKKNEDRKVFRWHEPIILNTGSLLPVDHVLIFLVKKLWP